MPFRMETPRLILRPFEERDIRAFANYRSDPEVARYQGWEAPYSLDKAQQLVSEMMARMPGEPGEWYQIAIERKTGVDLIGDVVFQRLHEDPHQAEIGFTLARSFHGQGFALEAVSALLDYLFGELGLHRVRANCDPLNEGSIRLLQKVGMRHEGRFIESLWFKGGWADEEWYALLEREWQERKLRQE